jgi:hypothetical protein
MSHVPVLYPRPPEGITSAAAKRDSNDVPSASGRERFAITIMLSLTSMRHTSPTRPTAGAIERQEARATPHVEHALVAREDQRPQHHVALP